jgi:diaminopimelate epimerase
MAYDIVIADPAKNITVFVTSAVPPDQRADAAKALLADPSLKAEQVGFVIPPSQNAPQHSPGLWRGAGLWRLEMMGGEFCGNAARSFGLYVARRTGLSGKVPLEIEISGMTSPVSVRLDVERGLAEASMPPALAQGTLACEGAVLPVYVFEGIAQVIAPDMAPSEQVFYNIKALFEADAAQDALPDALGVMFWDSSARLMTPAVYVRATDTLVFESSCGSGSAALGLYLTRNLNAGEELLALRQPGGVIEVRVKKQPGEAAAVSIGGPVTLFYPDESWL